jgi:hypothetical protein
MKEVSNAELLEVLKRIESKLDKKERFKNPFRKKTIEELLKKNFGDNFSDVKRIQNTDKYQVMVSDNVINLYYYINFNEGIFRNSIDVLMWSDKPMF